MKRAGILFLLTVVASVAAPQKRDWIEGTGSRDGANRQYYNQPARLPWRHLLGDWHDAKDVAQGDSAFAVVDIADTDQGRHVRWDVTKLVSRWLHNHHHNQGFLLRAVAGSGKIDFHSREHPTTDLRPTLELLTAKGTITLTAQADTRLDKSSYRSQGASQSLRVAADAVNSLIRFQLPEEARIDSLQFANLRLFTHAQYGRAQIGVFRCSQGHDATPSEPIAGLADSYPGDRGIQDDKRVIFAAQFESQRWAQEWSSLGNSMADSVAQDTSSQFEPFQGKAMRTKLVRGKNTALNAVLKFRDKLGRDPEEIYLRYYLRLADDWKQTVSGGKMPGISGTYGRSGWGGRKSDGTTGWSARGLFQQTIPPGNPLGGTTPIGTYCYHADMPGRYGDNWIWQQGYRGYLENNRWYCIEQHLKLNTPGKKDGILRAWIDGRPAFEKTNIRFRHNGKLKIEQIWMNVYHGGTRPSPHDQHLFIDNVVVATDYIGPIK
ncbi:MAG: polysaccharide lyase [Limisphaerales bacterium]